MRRISAKRTEFLKILSVVFAAVLFLASVGVLTSGTGDVVVRNLTALVTCALAFGELWLFRRLHAVWLDGNDVCIGTGKHVCRIPSECLCGVYDLWFVKPRLIVLRVSCETPFGQTVIFAGHEVGFLRSRVVGLESLRRMAGTQTYPGRRIGA